METNTPGSQKRAVGEFEGGADGCAGAVGSVGREPVRDLAEHRHEREDPGEQLRVPRRQ